MSGDVHLAAAGRLYSFPKTDRLARDPNFMPQFVSSAIVNAPPPDLLVKGGCGLLAWREGRGAAGVGATRPASQLAPPPACHPGRLEVSEPTAVSEPGAGHTAWAFTGISRHLRSAPDSSMSMSTS